MSAVKVHQTLGSGAVLDVDDDRVTIKLKDDDSSSSSSTKDPKKAKCTVYTALSSAVLNGGVFSHTSSLHILNAKVPPNYDGMTPDPDELLRRLATQHDLDPSSTVGLLTAASMQTLRISSRNADGVYVDAIVTAGISNSRSVGVDADFLGLGNNNNNNNNNNTNGESPAPPGTINTVVITNAELSKSALVEAHTISIEAKTSACAELDILCKKSGALAQGTGTDATVVVSTATTGGRHIDYAGKHTLFAEMLGQAVKEATREALLTNIYYIYGSRWQYALSKYRWKLQHLLGGARPCIPPEPMMPVPSAPISVLVVGVVLVLLAYIMPLPRSARVILAATAWDRYLASVPLIVHPVVLTGNLISTFIKQMPKRVFADPAIGFAMGCLLFVSVLGTALFSAALLLYVARTGASNMVQHIVTSYPNSEAIASHISDFILWIMEILLVNSSCTLQLLCTLALQMARFLERKQISQARAQLSWLCSRDPSTLNSSDLAAATLESLAENLSDSFVAPLCWYVLFGPLGALGYRVANTLDSRVGYHGKYEWFGKPSARFDDIINLIPARLTALLLVAAAALIKGCHAVDGWRAAWKDCTQCESPNAGWPMSAMAGLLGIILEKKGEYRLGCSIVPVGKEILPSPAHLRRGQQVAQFAGALAAAVAVLVLSVAEYNS
jgi:adenosylcobinamide-phosphate synthase